AATGSPMISITKGPIARGTIRTGIVLGLRLLVQAGTLLLVARLLGPREYGAFAGVAALAVVLGTVSTFGTQLVLLGEVSRDAARRAQILQYAVPFTLLCGTILLGIYLLLCTTVLHEAGVSISVLIAIGATELLLQSLLSLPAAEHLALGRIARSQLLTTLPLALRLAAAAAVILLRPANPLAAYGYGYFIASVIALVIATATMPAPWPRLRLWRLPNKTELREAAGYAALNVTATTPAELDKTLATKLLPLATSGLYAAGARVIGAATLPVVAMMLSALPRLFREGQDKVRQTGRLLRWVFGAAFAYGVALAIVLWFIAPVFVWLFGPRYTGIPHIVHWLCLAVPGMALRLVAGNVLMALGKPWMRAGFEVAGVVLLIIAAVILTAYLQATGMALALACSEWVMAVLGCMMVYSLRKRRLNESVTQLR
ncbi:MAG: lipopolysaccharide biosynthesis protein, partial [Gammaproteobacteria bacterium]